MSWPLDANSQTFIDYRQLLKILNRLISCNFIKKRQQKNRDRCTKKYTKDVQHGHRVCQYHVCLRPRGESIIIRPTPRGCDLILSSSSSGNPLPSIMTTSWIVCACSSAALKNCNNFFYIKGILMLYDLFTANYLCYDYTYTVVISPTV